MDAPAGHVRGSVEGSICNIICVHVMPVKVIVNCHVKKGSAIGAGPVRLNTADNLVHHRPSAHLQHGANVHQASCTTPTLTECKQAWRSST